jgi:hypothetical protein
MNPQLLLQLAQLGQRGAPQGAPMMGGPAPQGQPFQGQPGMRPAARPQMQPMPMQPGQPMMGAAGGQQLTPQMLSMLLAQKQGLMGAQTQ